MSFWSCPHDVLNEIFDDAITLGLIALVGVGLRVIDVSNVIIRNIKISKVLAEAGDAVGMYSNLVYITSVLGWWT